MSLVTTTAFFGIILLPNVQDISDDSSSNIVSHQTDKGFTLPQIAQRDFGEVSIDFILEGDLKELVLSALRVAIADTRVAPFLSRTVFFRSAIIRNMRVNKNEGRREIYSVSIVIKEIVQSNLAKLKLLGDSVGYVLGKRNEIVNTATSVANLAVESSLSIIEDTGDVIRAQVEDKTGTPMNESDPPVEAATVAATETDENGESFVDKVGG
jgi:hypothetical protein